MIHGTWSHGGRKAILSREDAKIDRSALVRILLLSAMVLAAQQTPWPGAPNLQRLTPLAASVAVFAGVVLGQIRIASLRMPLPLTLLLCLGALGALLSPAPWLAVPSLAEKAGWIIGTVALVRLFTPAVARRIATWALVALTLEQVGLAVWQVLSGHREVWGSLGTPNALARYVLMVWPVLALPAWSSRDSTTRCLATLLGLAMGGLLLGTGSRMAWAAFAAQVLSLAWRSHPRVVVAALAGAALMLVGAWDRLVFADDLQRVLAWRTALSLAWAYPLFGTGVGTFGSYYATFLPSDAAVPLLTPHNLALHLACEMGLLSLLLVAWLLIDGWRRLLQAQERANAWDAAFLRAARVVIVGLGVQSLVEY